MSIREIFEELKDIKCYEDSTTVAVSSKYYYELLEKLSDLVEQEDKNIETMYNDFLAKTNIPF